MSDQKSLFDSLNQTPENKPFVRKPDKELPRYTIDQIVYGKVTKLSPEQIAMQLVNGYQKTLQTIHDSQLKTETFVDAVRKLLETAKIEENNKPAFGIDAGHIPTVDKIVFEFLTCWQGKFTRLVAKKAYLMQDCLVLTTGLGSSSVSLSRKDAVYINRVDCQPYGTYAIHLTIEQTGQLVILYNVVTPNQFYDLFVIATAHELPNYPV